MNNEHRIETDGAEELTYTTDDRKSRIRYSRANLAIGHERDYGDGFVVIAVECPYVSVWSSVLPELITKANQIQDQK